MTVFANAVLGPDGRPLDQIRLTGVSATGHHGVFEHERVDGQEFRADVVLHLDTRPAATGDDLADTVSYADVAQDVHDVLAGSPADLIETVAERVAAAVLARPGVAAVDVRIHKPQAPIPVPFDDVEVAIRRDHVKLPVVDAFPVVDDVVEEPEPASEPEPEPLVAAEEPAEEPSPFVASIPLAVPAPVPAPPAAPFEPAAGPVQQQESQVHESPLADRLDADPPDAVEAVLAIGANLGDPQATLRAAVTDLDRLPGIQVMEVSPLARTTAVGGPEDQPDYLNAVLVVHTTLSPRGLLRATQAVENAHGRVRDERWGPRTLDVDIIKYGTLVADADDLTIPHPRAHERAFVLVPWAEAQPDALLPGLGGGPVQQLADTAPDRAGIRWLALDWLQQPAAEHPTGADPVEQVSEPVHPGPAEHHAAHDAEPAPSLPETPASPEPGPAPSPEAFVPQPAAPEQFHAPQADDVQHVHVPVPTPPVVQAPQVSQLPEVPDVPEVEQTSVDGQRWMPFGPDGGR